MGQTKLEAKKQLLDTHVLVRSFLLADERARNSDKWLEYLIFLYDTKLTTEELPFEVWDAARPFETIRRTRQKLQEEHPELQATDIKVKMQRGQIQEAYKEYFNPKNNGRL